MEDKFGRGADLEVGDTVYILGGRPPGEFDAGGSNTRFFQNVEMLDVLLVHAAGVLKALNVLRQ